MNISIFFVALMLIFKMNWLHYSFYAEGLNQVGPNSQMIRFCMKYNNFALDFMFVNNISEVKKAVLQKMTL